jgi:hypothetical protein
LSFLKGSPPCRIGFRHKKSARFAGA